MWEGIREGGTKVCMYVHTILGGGSHSVLHT